MCVRGADGRAVHPADAQIDRGIRARRGIQGALCGVRQDAGVRQPAGCAQGETGTWTGSQTCYMRPVGRPQVRVASRLQCWPPFAQALLASLERLKLDHVDLFLIHAPFKPDVDLVQVRAGHWASALVASSSRSALSA